MTDIISVAATQTSGAGINTNTEASRVNELIPSYLKENAQGLIGFIEDYYKWLNKDTGPSKLIDNIVREQDIDQTSLDFLDGIQGEIARNIPNSAVLDRVSLYKKIVQYYKIKGSEDSVSAFFRIFYDEIVSVSYPKEQLFKLSSGNWEKKNVVEDTILRANYIGGTVPLSTTHIGTKFNILNLAGQNIGDAILSSFTNIDEGFDAPLNEAQLELQFDAFDETTVGSGGSDWTETSFDVPSRVTVDATDVVYNEDDNIWTFDGEGDYLQTPDAVSDITYGNEHTLLARLARIDNVTGDHDQCVISMANIDTPHQGIELYLDRSSGAIGRRFTDIGKPMIFRDEVNRITLSNFPDVWALNDQWFLMDSQVEGKDAYIKNFDNIGDDIDFTDEDVIYFGIDDRYYIESASAGVLYYSQGYIGDDVAAQNVHWVQVRNAGEEDTFSSQPFAYDERTIVTDDYLFHRSNLYNVELYKKDNNDEWYFHTNLESGSPMTSMSYDASVKSLVIGTPLEKKVYIYDLDTYDLFQEFGTISGTDPRFGLTVSADNSNIIVGQYDYMNDEWSDSTLTRYTRADLVTGSIEANHSHYARIFGDDIISISDNIISFKAKKLGIDNHLDKPCDVAYDSANNLVIVANPHKEETYIYENIDTGFWTAPEGTASSVSITLENNTTGISQTIGWGPEEDSYMTSTGSQLLTKIFTSGELDDSNGVSNWQRIQTISSKSYSVAVDGNNLLIGGDSVDYYVYSGPLFVYNINITSSSINYGKKLSLFNNEVSILGFEELQKLYTYKLDNLVGSLDEPIIDFINTPIEYGIKYSNAQLPAITELSKYHVVAIQGKRDRFNGFIKVSINGGNYETIFEGDTLTFLELDETSHLTMGQNGNGEDYFKGHLTNVYFYNRLVDTVELVNIKEYLDAKANEWYILQFGSLNGTLVGVNQIVETSGEYIFDTLSGYEVDQFWILDEAPSVGTQLAIDVTYGPVLSKTQRVAWGDNTSQAFVKQNNGNKLRHVFTGVVAGKYLDQKGFLSNNNKLHDGDKWQEFSYVINPSISPKLWQQEFLSLVHPAGMKYIAALLLLLPRTRDWVGPNIEFDSASQKYIWNKPSTNFIAPYETKRPKWDLDWMHGLVPETREGVNHSPIYQPGWLDDYQAMLMVIGGDMFPNGANAEEFLRVNKLCLQLFNELTPGRDERAREDYKQNLKFKDHNPITDYLYVPISQAIEDFSENDYLIRFSNWSSIIEPLPSVIICEIIQGGNSTTTSFDETIDGGLSSPEPTETLEAGDEETYCSNIDDGGNSFEVTPESFINGGPSYPEPEEILGGGGA